VVDDEKSRSSQRYVDTMVDVEAHNELSVDRLGADELDDLMHLDWSRCCVAWSWADASCHVHMHTRDEFLACNPVWLCLQLADVLGVAALWCHLTRTNLS
jgi:hypothetical protein